MFENITRIFFDSGMVLIYPRSGDWFLPDVYFEYCNKFSLKTKSLHQSINFKKAYYHLCQIRQIVNEEQELQAFQTFYEILFSGLKGKDNPNLVRLCCEATVNDNRKYLFYDDVEVSIGKLNCKYELGLISDAWPSLFNVYRNCNMYRYFEPFIVSSMYGCTKEGYDLFKFAMANVAQKPNECLFIDDSYGNCKRAMRMGMEAIVLNRDKYYKGPKDILHLHNLKQLEEVLGIY